MSTLSVTNTFSNGTSAEADEVNTNFTDVTNFVNGEVVHVDGTNAMTAQLSLVASDPSSANHATRKQYVDRKTPTIVAVSIPLDTSVSSGDVLGSTTITDPGYDIELWGWAQIHYAADSGSIWELRFYVDGVLRNALTVPFVSLHSPIGQSIGTPLKRTAHATGSNCGVSIYAYRVAGTGTLTLGSPGSPYEAWNSAEVQWRKSG